MRLASIALALATAGLLPAACADEPALDETNAATLQQCTATSTVDSLSLTPAFRAAQDPAPASNTIRLFGDGQDGVGQAFSLVGSTLYLEDAERSPGALVTGGSFDVLDGGTLQISLAAHADLTLFYAEGAALSLPWPEPNAGAVARYSTPQVLEGRTTDGGAVVGFTARVTTEVSCRASTVVDIGCQSWRDWNPLLAQLEGLVAPLARTAMSDPSGTAIESRNLFDGAFVPEVRGSAPGELTSDFVELSASQSQRRAFANATLKVAGTDYELRVHVEWPLRADGTLEVDQVLFMFDGEERDTPAWCDGLVG